MGYKILHIGDIHLDMVFASRDEAFGKLRRRQLKAAFERALRLARERDVSAVCIAGDLYEREHASLDLGEYLRRVLGELSPMRVFISPGNHDPYVPASLYRAIEPLPDNVTIFRERRFRPVSLTDGLTLWGFGHERERDLDPALGDFHCSGPGAHLLLFHGSDRNRIPPHKECIAPFSAEEIGRSGALHAMVGHFHGMVQGPNYAYSGSPEPLNFAQDGRHTASLVSVEDGHLGLDFIDINATRYVEVEVDMAGIGDRAHAAAAIQAKVAGQVSSPGEAFCRVRLVGVAPPTLDLDPDDLRAELDATFPGIEIMADYATFDVDELEREGHTVRAAFLKALRGRRAQSQVADAELLDKAVQYGLIAFTPRALRP